jgi:signal peptidase I
MSIHDDFPSVNDPGGNEPDPNQHKRPGVWHRWRYRRGPSPRRNTIEWAIILVGAILAAFVIRTFLFQAFYIPSASMEDTLKIHDRVLVNRLSYQLHPIHRGDIVVFKKPSTPQAEACYAGNAIHDLIKRVVGLPGETVESTSDGTILINGKSLDEPYIKPGVELGPPVQKTTVPEKSVWVMGDNRPVSRDSRCAGAIPEKDIVGRAFIVMWPLDRTKFLK